MSQSLAPHRVIAERVRALRRLHGWSAQRLAEQLSSVGIAWDRSIVANFENGRRASVSVEEFLALAYVLSVAPVHLLVPIDTDVASYRITPKGRAVTTGFVRSWVCGTVRIDPETLEPIGSPEASEIDWRRYFLEMPGPFGAYSIPMEPIRRTERGDDDG